MLVYLLENQGGTWELRGAETPLGSSQCHAWQTTSQTRRYTGKQPDSFGTAVGVRLHAYRFSSVYNVWEMRAYWKSTYNMCSLCTCVWQHKGSSWCQRSLKTILTVSKHKLYIIYMYTVCAYIYIIYIDRYPSWIGFLQDTVKGFSLKTRTQESWCSVSQQNAGFGHTAAESPSLHRLLWYYEGPVYERWMWWSLIKSLTGSGFAE